MFIVARSVKRKHIPVRRVMSIISKCSLIVIYHFPTSYKKLTNIFMYLENNLFPRQWQSLRILPCDSLNCRASTPLDVFLHPTTSTYAISFTIILYFLKQTYVVVSLLCMQCRYFKIILHIEYWYINTTHDRAEVLMQM